MNNRYLYRAKRTDNGEWVEGYYAVARDIRGIEQHNILIADNNLGYFNWIVVDPYTVCQCTGLKGIYEHDIFECDGEIYEIVFDQEDLVWWADGYGHQYIQLGEFKPDEINVIGNSIDNTELLEVEE